MKTETRQTALTISGYPIRSASVTQSAWRLVVDFPRPELSHLDAIERSIAGPAGAMLEFEGATPTHYAHGRALALHDGRIRLIFAHHPLDCDPAYYVVRTPGLYFRSFSDGETATQVAHAFGGRRGEMLLRPGATTDLLLSAYGLEKLAQFEADDFGTLHHIIEGEHAGPARPEDLAAALRGEYAIQDNQRFVVHF